MDVRIDTLRLQVGGIDGDSAQRLAGLIAQRLSIAPSAARPGSLGSVGVTVHANAGGTLDGLADSAAAAVLRAIPPPPGQRETRPGGHSNERPAHQGSAGRLPADTDAPSPIVTGFQFNPEKMVHTWSQPAPPSKPSVEEGNPLAVAGLPGETFQFTISLDADEDVTGQVQQLAQAAQDHGVGGRLAALEMLLYPVTSARAGVAQPTPGSGAATAAQPGTVGGLAPSGQAAGGLVGTASAASGSGTGNAGPTWAIPNSILPVVLFVWGRKRILPVRVTTLTITETLYDTNLNPTHAEAVIGLRVLTPTQLFAARPDAGTPVEKATTAYKHTLDWRRAWARTDAANAPSSIIGMLP